jgi:3-oxoadipate enol-lactonase
MTTSRLIRLADGTQLRVADSGSGPALLFAHCLGGSLDVWAAQQTFFCKTHRCVAYDLQGQGESPLGGPGPLSMAQLAEEAIALLDALGIEQCVFVGISMGAMVGLHAALQAPERFAGLVPADSAAGFDAAGRQGWADRIAGVRAEGLEPLVETMMDRWFSPAFRQREPATVAKIADRLRATPVDGYLASCAAIRDHDLRDRLEEIACPTLVICGELDPSTPLPLSQALAAGIPGARLEVIAGAHHLSNLECPEVFNRALDQFLSSISWRTS